MTDANRLASTEARTVHGSRPATGRKPIGWLMPTTGREVQGFAPDADAGRQLLAGSCPSRRSRAPFQRTLHQPAGDRTRDVCLPRLRPLATRTARSARRHGRPDLRRRSNVRFLRCRSSRRGVPRLPLPGFTCSPPRAGATGSPWDHTADVRVGRSERQVRVVYGG